MEKFRLSDIWRVITADSSVFAGNNSDASRDFVVLVSLLGNHKTSFSCVGVRCAQESNFTLQYPTM